MGWWADRRDREWLISCPSCGYRQPLTVFEYMHLGIGVRKVPCPHCGNAADVGARTDLFTLVIALIGGALFLMTVGRACM